MPVDQSKIFYIDGFPVLYSQIEEWYGKYKLKTPKVSNRLPDPYFSEKCCWFIAGEIVKEFQKPLNTKMFDTTKQEDYQIDNLNKNKFAIQKAEYWNDDREQYCGETDDLIQKTIKDMEKKYKEAQEQVKKKQEEDRIRQKANADFWKTQNQQPSKPKEPEKIFEWRKILNIPINVTITVDIIKKAYRKESIKRHPDTGGSMEKMMELFKARDTACYIIGEDPNEHFR